MRANQLDLLGRTAYVRLTTFRRNSTPVHTPVWVARQGDRLLVWTDSTTGKVKRVRNNSRVQVVPCSRMGAPLGEPIDGDAEIVEGDLVATTRRLLGDKYATAPIYLWIVRLMDKFSGNDHVVLAISLR